MAGRDLEAALRQAEDEIGRRSMPADAQVRVRERVVGRRARRPIAIGLVFTSAVVVIIIGAWALAGRSSPRQVAGFEVVAVAEGARVEALASGAAELAVGTCVLATAEGQTLELAGPATVALEGRDVRVRRGRVTFDVPPRGALPEFRVLVSHGRIEVVGTRFTVEQGPEAGELLLQEGVVRFVHASGEVRQLVAGERITWPPPSPRVEAPVEPVELEPVPAPQTRKSAAPALAPIRYVDADDLLRQVAELRSRGEHAEAVRFLAHGLKRELRPATREVLDYELGAILTWQMGDARRACAHWRAHQQTFSEGRYHADVLRAIAHAGCEASK